MKWGTTTLNVLKNTYKPPFAVSDMNKINLIPGADNSEPADVLQQGGRGRYQVGFSGYTIGATDYDSFYEDYLNATEKTFEGLNSFSMSMIITDIQLKPESNYPIMCLYDITLTEV